MNDSERSQFSFWDRIKAFLAALDSGSGYVVDVLESQERRIVDLERQLEELGRRPEESQCG